MHPEEPSINVLFRPGPINVTPGAMALLHSNPVTIATYLVRHLTGDGGKIGEWPSIEVPENAWQMGALATSDDAVLNRIALSEGGRICSYYDIEGETLYIITDAVNSEDAVTTILLSQEY